MSLEETVNATILSETAVKLKHKPGEPILCGSATVSRHDSLWENTVRVRELVIQMLKESSERMDPNQDYVFEARLVAK